MFAVNWGLCLPRRRMAIWEARRPSVLPAASTTYQSLFTWPALALKVFINRYPKNRRASDVGARGKGAEYYGIRGGLASRVAGETAPLTPFPGWSWWQLGC